MKLLESAGTRGVVVWPRVDDYLLHAPIPESVAFRRRRSIGRRGHGHCLHTELG